MKTRGILLLVILAMIQVFVYFYIGVCAHSCNDSGPGLGGVQALLSGNERQKPRGQLG